MDPLPIIIETHDLWKTYGRFDALRGLNLAVPQGSVFALLGANGAGKTTAIKALLNIVEPTRGKRQGPGGGVARDRSEGVGTNWLCVGEPSVSCSAARR